MTSHTPMPENENERLDSLDAYDIMDTAPEMKFDEITELAAEILQCPVSFIQFMNEDRQWFKSKYGLPDDLVDMPRDVAICATTICQSDLLLVPDCSKDERFSDKPYVAAEPNFRFYAGMPLITPTGHAVGTICTMDFESKEISLSQQDALRRLSHQVVTQLELRRTLLEMDSAIHRQNELFEELSSEKARADELLLNILPARVADELKEKKAVQPKFYSTATLLFTDFVGFTSLSEKMEPKSLIELLDQYFSAFDKIIEKHQIEKLKTIGDAYMCISGVPSESRGHAIRMCLAALELQEYVEKSNIQREKLRMPRWDMRIGIHSGPVIAGVVGQSKFTYDVWGDTVNVASLMETNSTAGKINISETTCQQVKEIFDIEDRGIVASGKKGDLRMHYLGKLLPEYSQDARGVGTNSEFEKKYASTMRVYE